MALLADACDPPPDYGVPGFSHWANKSVTRQRSRSRWMRGKYDARIESTGHGNSHLLPAGKVLRKTLGQGRTEFLIVRIRGKRRLPLPLTRLEVTAPAYKFRVLEFPHRGRRQDANSLEDRTVFQNTTERCKLAKRSIVDLTEFRSRGQNGLCLTSKIEAVFGLVVAEPVHAISIIEERDFLPPAICNQPVEEAIEILNKITVLLIFRHQVGAFGRAAGGFPASTYWTMLGIFLT